MNANYLKAPAALLVLFFAIVGVTPPANAQTELTLEQTRDYIVQLWNKCDRISVTADGDEITADF